MATDTNGEAEAFDPQESLIHPAHIVYFRAGLIACREYMARFVGATHPQIAASIRANWWPSLGEDFGPPRQIRFDELAHFDEATFKTTVKGPDEVSPTQEALAVAWKFLGTLGGHSPGPVSPDAVFTRPECTFNYCMYPEHGPCRIAGKCQHPQESAEA